MRNAILLVLLTLSILGLLAYISWYIIRFIYNGIAHTELPMWGLWFLILLVISFLLMLFTSEKPDKSIVKK